MKIKMFLSFITLFFLFDNVSFAQYRIDGVTFSPSIQNRSYIKYGGLQSHDLNTGTVFVKIPLYTYQDKDFTIPISVDYASNGYIPNVQAGVLGLGWYLNTGGCIIREVKGIPDNAEKGFLNAYFNQAPTNWEITKERNRDNSSSAYTQFANGTETESDIYHFRFLNYSGSFILGSKNTIYIYNSSHSKDEYRIDFRRLMGENMIIITTSDGYKYIFGGRFQNDLDKTANNGSTYQQTSNLTWVLSKIESPNGRFVSFNYSTRIPCDIYQPISYYFHKSNVANAADWTDEYSYTNTHENEFRIAAYSQYDFILTSIDIDRKVTVGLTYGPKTSFERSKSPANSSIANLKNTGQLNGIQIVDFANNKAIKNITFEYQLIIRPTTSSHSFLSSINFPNNEQYAFSYYNNTAIFPYHGTTQIDHWGYFCHPVEAAVPSLLPSLSCDLNKIEAIGSSNREPVFGAAKFGMLQKVAYPAKGYTIFEYEGNSYTLKVDRNNLTQWLPAIVAKNVGGFDYNNVAAYPAGGVRLKKTANYASPSECVTTEYLYSDKAGNQSGILLYYPRYINGVVTRHDSLNIPVYQRIIKREASDFINPYVDRQHIEYSSVLEKHSDNSFIEHHFTNYVTTPDQLSVTSSSKALSNGNEINAISPDTLYQYDTKVPSRGHLRGILTEKVLNNSSGVCVRKFIFDHAYLDQTRPYTSIHKTAADVYLYQNNINDKYLTKVSQIDYFGGDSIVRKLHYGYSNSGRLISGKENNNDRDIESITYYADSISSSPFRNINKESTNWNYLIANELKYPIGELTYSNGKVIHGKIYYYTLLTNVSGKQYCVLSRVGTLKIPGISQDAISESSFELESRNDLFGSEGQVLQRTGSNGSVNSFLWGYKGGYIIAEISGTSFDIVQQTLGATKFSGGIYIDDSLSPEDEAQLRSIPNALVKTFTYAPFIGITSISDYNGKKTTVEYDASGRPQKIVDNNGAIIEEYEYHFSWL